ncbi:MAG TPA: HEAT repeat domain-containing protein [Candidatus Binatia bacterium]|jgi:HEAT repeat protein
MKGVEDKIVALIADLDHPEKAKIRTAVDALIDLSASAPSLRATLEESLDDKQRKNRWAIAYVLGHLPQPSGSAIRVLLSGLDHGEPDIRWAIALLLIRIAKNGGNLANSLLALCANGTVNQKRMAIYCIRDLEFADDASMRTLLAAAGDEEPTVRVAALISLKSRSDAGAAARHRLLERFINDPDARVRNASAITLAQLGAPDEAFFRALEQGAQSSDPRARKAALAALALLQKKRPAPCDS